MTEHDPTAPDPAPEAGAPAPEELFDAEIVLEEETVDGLPVLADSGALTLAPRLLPPVQAAAVAATGFLAGAATLALLRRAGVRRLGREVGELRELRDRYEAARRSPQPFGMVPGQSYLVQIRVLGRPVGRDD